MHGYEASVLLRCRKVFEKTHPWTEKLKEVSDDGDGIW